MTPEQQALWDDYACVPRCIIKLSEISGHPITVDEFIDRFGPRCTNWPDRFGLVPWKDCLTFCIELGLATAFYYVSEIDIFRKGISSGIYRGAFVSSRLCENPPGNWYENNHCRLFYSISDTHITLLDPTTANPNAAQDITHTYFLKEEPGFYCFE